MKRKSHWRYVHSAPPMQVLKMEAWTSSRSFRKQVPVIRHSSENYYLTEMKPLLLLLRILGRFPYSFSDTGVNDFKVSSFVTFYTVIYFICQTWWTWYVLKGFYRQFLESSSFNEYIFCIAVGLFPIQNLTVPFTYWLEAPKIKSYVECWKQFTTDFSHEQFEFTLKKPITIFSLVCLPVTFIIVHAEGILLADIPMSMYVPYIVSVTSRYTLLVFWCSTLYQIRAVACNLQTKVKEGGLEKLSMYRHIWIRLSSLTTQLGDSVSHSFLHLTILLFTIFLLASYGFISFCLAKNETVDGRNIIGILISVVVSFFHHLIFCDAAHRTTSTVGKDFTSIILQMDPLEVGPNNHDEVFIFLETISSMPPDVLLLGSVKVTRNLFLAFVLNTVTYLVVLVQFRISTNTSYNNTILSNNGIVKVKNI